MHPGPIGIFDSGIGGLTVVRSIFHYLPGESTVYFGDTARLPYGPKSPDTVRRYSLEILHWLLGRGVKAVVIACNTSTAHALDTLRRESPVPVIGVIQPGARAAVAAAPGGRIGVIGTAGTIGSNAYAAAIRALDPSAEVVQQACPLFVPLVEEGWFEHPAAELIAREYLESAFCAGHSKPKGGGRRAAEANGEGVGALVLGCTHYPLLRPLIQRVMGDGVTLIDSGDATARELAGELDAAGLRAPAGSPVEHHFTVSDDAARFGSVGSRFLGEQLRPADVVRLG